MQSDQPYQAIIEDARGHGDELIFVGTRGMSATATKLLHLSSIPVLLVK